MKAMILAAGEGRRLRPLTYDLPKPLMPIVNKPIIDHIIEHLRMHRFDEIIINTHYKAGQFIEHFTKSSNPYTNLNFSIEDNPMGTAGGVKKAEFFFNDTFLVIGGDDLSDINLSELVEFHKEKGAIATIALSLQKNIEQFGVVVTDKEGKILDFQEKPKTSEAKSNWANTGIYLFDHSILDLIPSNIFYDFGRQLFPLLLQKGVEFYGYKTTKYWKDIGNLLDYRAANFDILTGRVKQKILANPVMEGLWIGKGVEFPPDTKIKGPVIIGDNSVLGRDVIIEGPAIIGKFNKINNGAKIISSIIWNNNTIRKNVSITDCIISNKCNIDENLIIENCIISEEMTDIHRADYYGRVFI